MAGAVAPNDSAAAAGAADDMAGSAGFAPKANGAVPLVRLPNGLEKDGAVDVAVVVTDVEAAAPKATKSIGTCMAPSTASDLHKLPVEPAPNNGAAEVVAADGRLNDDCVAAEVAAGRADDTAATAGLPNVNDGSAAGASGFFSSGFWAPKPKIPKIQE